MRRALSIRTQVLGLCAALLLIAAVGQLLFGTFFARAYFLNQKKAEIEDFFWHIRDNYPGMTPKSYTNYSGKGRMCKISGWLSTAIQEN